MGKPIYKVGINDVKEPSHSRRRFNSPLRANTWYQCWKDLIKRCYSEKFQEKFPAYKNCTLDDRWLLASNFKKWYDDNYIEGYLLVKDVIVIGNNEYSPDTCMFVSRELNKILLKKNVKRDCPIGVTKRGNSYQAFCNNSLSGEYVYLGSFDTPNEAHKIYCIYKNYIIEQMASKYPLFRPYYKQHLLIVE